MEKKYHYLSLPFYLIGTLCAAAYLFAEFYPGVMLMPVNRILLLCLCCIGVYIGSRILCKAPTVDKQKVMKRTFLFFFAAYLLLVLTFTLFDPAFGRNQKVRFVFSDRALLKNSLENEFNIVPFRTISLYVSALFTHHVSLPVILTNLLGNFVAFMPLGLFLPMFVRKCRHFAVFLLTTSLTVLCVETLQFLFIVGFCDIDDLILNVFGACVAFLILRIQPVRRLVNKFCLEERKDEP
ncbi:MAG: VanZ family protein [Oscillospiraceae bacterium]|nr:VanZ family protein [Oscillospiraceae bacterium]